MVENVSIALCRYIILQYTLSVCVYVCTNASHAQLKYRAFVFDHIHLVH